MIMNFFCSMVHPRKTFSLVSNQNHCQRSSPTQISNTPQTGFEPVQNLSSGFIEWSCVVVITTTPRRHFQTADEKSKIKTASKNISSPHKLSSYISQILLILGNQLCPINTSQALNYNFLNKLSLSQVSFLFLQYL